MKSTVPLFALVISVLALSCKDDTSSPPLVQSFSVNVSVKTPSGEPVAGLRVSAWNHLSFNFYGPNSGGFAVSSVTHPNAASALRFDLPIRSRVKLGVYDLNDSLVETLVDAPKEAGAYSYIWNTSDAGLKTGVYKIAFVVRDTTGSTIAYSDSIYAVLWQPDPSISVIGWTGAVGTYSTTDKLLFPNVFDLPPLNRTQSDPAVIQTYHLQDTVTFVVTDTLTHRAMTFVRVVVNDQVNNVQVVWNPASDGEMEGSRKTPGGSARSGFLMSEIPVRIPVVAKLYQNYPNPFN